MERVEGNSQQPEVVRYSRLANIDLMAADLRAYGEVRAEIRERVWNESLTYLLEGLDAPLVTRFERRFADGDIRAEDGTSLGEMLRNGIKSAEYDAALDPRMQFEVERRRAEYGGEYEAVLAIMRPESSANTVVSISPFPEEAYLAHGKGLLEEKGGYQTRRRLGFVRVHHRTGAGIVQSTSLSIDNSYLTVLQQAFGSRLPVEAFASTTALLGHSFSLDLDTASQKELPQVLREAYDRALAAQFPGDQFSAGRKAANEQDASDLVEAHKGIFEHYISAVEALAHSRNAQASDNPITQQLLWTMLQARDEWGNQLVPNNFQREQLTQSLAEGSFSEDVAELAKVGLDFITWAKLKTALRGEASSDTSFAEFAAIGADNAVELVADGEVFVSCGGGVSLKSGEPIATSPATEEYVRLFHGVQILKCVNCPFCKKTVDAKKTATRLSCLDCKAEVSLITGEPINKGNSIKKVGQAAVTTSIDLLLQDITALFTWQQKKNPARV